MNVMARLGGDTADLEAIGRLFNHGDTRVAKDSEGYYLTSPDLDAVAGGALLEIANALVRQVNGIGRVLAPGFQPVRAEGRFDRKAADGSKTTEVVVSPDSINMRITVGTPTVSANGVVVQPPPSPAPDWVELGRSNVDVRDVLRFLGTAEGDGLNWSDMSKVCEVIRVAVGGNVDDMIARRWLTRDEWKLFGNSVNHPAISGDAARHARRQGPVPAKAMSLHEGRAFVYRLAEAWLRSL